MIPGVFEQLQDLLGSSSVHRGADGLPHAVPDAVDGIALVCRTANAEGWRVRVEGSGGWLQPDAPADVVLSLRELNRILSVSPADLVVSVEAGVTLGAIRRQLAEHGMWLALDPPGRPERSLGGVLATGTSGPLRATFGGVRDHVLGCTVVTGEGRRITVGGRVVKNVAGYDLTRLQVGAFGAFGLITEAHLRLRALPRADRTLLCRGSRARLLAAARALREARLVPAALELLSPAAAAESEWVLAARVMGAGEAVEAGVQQIPAASGADWSELEAERSGTFWSLCARSVLAAPVTLRLAGLPAGLDELLDLLAHDLGEGLISASAADGLVRWAGEGSADQIRRLRLACAGREIPLTLERGPWALRESVGHFGAYHEGVGGLVERLRDTFDPNRVFSLALESPRED